VKLESKFRRARAATEVLSSTTTGLLLAHQTQGTKVVEGHTQVHIYLTTQFGGGRELLSPQFSGISFQCVYPTAQGSQFSLELFLQTTNGSQIIRIQTGSHHLSQNVHTGVQTSGELKTSQATLTSESPVRITLNTTVGF
jgi:hypothetical protein